MTAPSLRDRIIAAAAERTAVAGWSSVTMSRLADDVGVSRQTVYNEVGAKPALAEAMVLDELARFLAVVEAAFDEHPGDAVESVRAAVRGVLERAERSPLLRAIASASQGGDTELLPLLTTQAGSLLAASREVLRGRLRHLVDDRESADLDTAIDAVVRLVLSNVMQPSGSPAATADEIAWVAGRLL